MIEIECVTKQWGNSSLACIIPKEIVKQRHIKENQRIKLILEDSTNILKETFGSLKNWARPTEEILKEVDKELWNE